MDEKKEERIIPEKKTLRIGRYKIDYTRISVERTLKAGDAWRELQERKFASDYARVKAMIDPVLMLIRIDFRLSKLFDWVKRRMISSRYILRHLDYSELSGFLEDALSPILGSKKKEEEYMKRLTDAGLALIEALGPEKAAIVIEEFLNGGVAKRLQPSSRSVVSSTGGPGSTASGSSPIPSSSSSGRKPTGLSSSSATRE